jgi:3-methyladenine DNA glycosylase AlkD
MKVRVEFVKAADVKKAPQMQAYMKSVMPYHGVPAPGVKKICKEVFHKLEFSTHQRWKEAVLAIWHGAKFREERYAAIHLCAHKSAREFQRPEALALYEELIVTGAWWDFVDTLASHSVGDILAKHPKATKRKMLSWSKDSNLWKRRTSIICQLGFKKETDLELLYSCIEPSLGFKEFFLQKAIGWALRQYAWTDPKETLRYVEKNRAKLAPLSRREALKNISKGKL